MKSHKVNESNAKLFIEFPSSGCSTTNLVPPTFNDRNVAYAVVLATGMRPNGIKC